MVNKGHLEVLKRGARAWNGWRNLHPLEAPDFQGADLNAADLSGADLSGADFMGAKLIKASLRGTSLVRAYLGVADLTGADLTGADLTGATLFAADLRLAILIRANLSNTNLDGATFRDTELSGANVSQALAGATIFADVDLHDVVGLESIKHTRPSAISVSTIYRSEGQIPEVFLRGCGVPEDFITQIQALLTAVQPIQFYSCFISYSSVDQQFAERLHADLQSRGVRVWFAPHDMRIGARIRSTIDESIRVYDKLLLVLSEASVSSQWVEQEVETALRKERRPEGGTVLFPVRLDDSVLKTGEGWPALIKDTRHVGDFTRWKDHDSYRVAFERLMRDLKASA